VPSHRYEIRFPERKEKISFVGGGRRQHFFEQVFFVNYKLGLIGIKDFTARCHPSFSAPLRFSWTMLGWLWAVRARLAV